MLHTYVANKFAKSKHIYIYIIQGLTNYCFTSLNFSEPFVR